MNRIEWNSTSAQEKRILRPHVVDIREHIKIKSALENLSNNIDKDRCMSGCVRPMFWTTELLGKRRYENWSTTIT